MKKYRHTKINIPIYSSNLYIFQGKQKAIGQITKDFKLNWADDNFETISAFSWKFPLDNKHYGYGVFFQDKWSNKGAFSKEVAHECCHLKNFIFFDRGVELDLINDESEAYLLGWLVQNCVNFLKYKKK